MGQATCNRDISQKRAGMPVDFQAASVGDIVTGRNDLSTAIYPGRFVVQGTSDDDVKIQNSGAAGGVYVGLAVDINTRERTRGASTTDGFVENALLPVAKDGRWYVETEEAVTKGGQVYVRFVAGAGGSVIGLARTDADTASAEAINATFDETVGSAGIAAVTLSLNQV